MSIMSDNLNKDISVVRIVFEFYPLIGGSIIHTLDLSKRINPYLKKQTIIAPDFGDDCKNFDKHVGIEILRVKYHNFKKIWVIPVLPLNYIAYGLNVYALLKKMEGPYIIHAHGIFNITLSKIIGKLLNVPTVGMLHGSIGAYSKTYDFLETILSIFFRPDYAFVVDDGSLAPEKFKKLWGNRVTIVNHGIDSNFFKHKKKSERLLHKIGVNESDFLILSTSSLLPVKRIDLTIKSFKIFLDIVRKDNVYLLIVGCGPLQEFLINLTKELHIERNVIFLGGIQKNVIQEYLSIADVVVATSLYSNMNLSVQEAMACEIPVVVFDSGGIGRLIKHMKNGILVKSGNLEDFARYIFLLYENLSLREEIGKNSRKTIVEEKSWDVRIKQELDIYSRLC